MTERTALVGEPARWPDQIVDQSQLKGWPDSTLLCARIMKALIVLAVVSTTVTLFLSYFGGALVLQTAVVKLTDFPLPQLVLCPIWGQAGLRVDSVSAAIGNIGTAPFRQWSPVQAEAAACKASSFKYLHLEEDTAEVRPMTDRLGSDFTCACVSLPPGTALHTDEDGKEALQVSFKASFEDGHEVPDLSFGFAPGPGLYPSEWAYARLDHRNLGSLELEMRTFGKTALTPGTTMKSFTYHNTATYPNGSTEIVVQPRSFFVTKVKDVSSVFSVFAMVSFLILVMANLNSVALFNQCFPGQVDKKQPQQLAPHWCLQQTCSLWPCCRPVGKDVDV